MLLAVSATGTTTSTNAMKCSVILPSVLAIGFSGHRHLADEAKSRAQILQVLKEKKENTPGIVYGVSSVAAGGDLLFAETCMQLGLPLRILLPMPKEQFREDFDEPTWERVENVLRKAISVEVTGGDQSRDAQYYECGIETVQQSRLLLALWDGESSQGLGGTEQIVSFAKLEGRPVVWIHSQSGAIQRFNEDKELLNDPELDFLNALPDTEKEPHIRTPGDLARAWFLKIDTNASHASPQVRRLAAIPILCTAAASVLSTVGTIAGGSALWLGIGSGLGFTVGALPALMKMQQRQVLWARIRTATEICRSNLSFWKTPKPYNVIGPEVVPELTGMLTSLNFLKMSDKSGSEADLEEFKRDYRKGRVQDQMDYFSRNAARSDRKAKQYQVAITLSIIVALVANIWMLLSAVWLKRMTPDAWKPLLALSGSVFFQLATIAGAMLVVNDYQRRRQRYRELHNLLEEWDKQLEFARTWPILMRIAERVEKALLAEVIEWRSLVRNHKLPRR
jgi:hypothetical protein